MDPKATRPFPPVTDEDKALVLRALENHRAECLQLATSFVAKYGQCRAAEMLATEAQDTTRVLSLLS